MPKLKTASGNVQRVARILEAEGIPIEAGLLFSINGLKKARLEFDAYPDMYVSKIRTEPLRGVVMADTLTLPEKVKIDADTVIIAKNITFSGRAPIIKGPHDIHLFVFDSAKVTNGPEIAITIDTSGYGRKEWLESQELRAAKTSKKAKTLANHAVRPVQDSSGTKGADGALGTSGSNGTDGTDGADGPDGTCATNKNGLNGNAGTAGTAAGHGGPGGNGAPGTNAGNQTINIGDVNAGPINVIARGGDGGNGGPGGAGGIPGNGGDGGDGGDGANCACTTAGGPGPGNGGNGGAAGAGGAGGNGGNGGTGGAGGNGGTVVVNYPWGYNASQVSVNVQGGAGGLPGIAGSATMGGSAGDPGEGGDGGSSFLCEGQDGSAGTAANGGAGANGGTGGNAGGNGTSGSVIWNIQGGSQSGGGGGGGGSMGWEPGTFYGYCTEWWEVSFHCEAQYIASLSKDKKRLANHAKPLLPITAAAWTCFETGRTYLGCF